MSVGPHFLRRYMKVNTPVTFVSYENSTTTLLQKIFREYPQSKPSKGVIHVGAHRCEEKKVYKALGIQDTLWIDANDELCVENSSIVNALISNCDDKEVDFIITNNDGMSSSMLELKEHLLEHPDCLEVKRVRKKTITLNSLMKRLSKGYDAYDFLVLDIQGAELLALEGSSEILPHIKVVMTEVSNKELYRGTALIGNVDAFMNEQGFVSVYENINHHGWGDAVYLRKTDILLSKRVSVEVHSGLGNRLFQMAFLYGIAHMHDIRPVLIRSMLKPCRTHFADPFKYHAFYKLFEIIDVYDFPQKVKTIVEDRNEPCTFKSYQKDTICLNDNREITLFKGFFQSEKYWKDVKEDIKCAFSDILEKNYRGEKHDLSDTMFIHVRGRDHIHNVNSVHKMDDIDHYYQKCLERTKDEDIRYVIFTDDLTYLSSLRFVNFLESYDIIQVDELDTIYLMTQCGKGGICSNSTFSWWGSYLNASPNKRVYMPTPFLNGLNYEDIYYEGVEKVSMSHLHNILDDVVNIRVINDECIVTLVLTKDKTIHECRINGVAAEVQMFDKKVHDDIYCTVYMLRARNEEWRGRRLKMRVQVNREQKDFWVRSSETVKKYDIVAMTMFKDDAALIPSYVCYYRKMGVEHFFLYYNNCVPVSTLPQYEDVTYIQWNYPYYHEKNHYAQIGALMDFTYFSKHIASYVLFNDLDEYIFWKGPPGNNFKTFIIQNNFDVYGFLNCFIYLKHKNTEVEATEEICKMIENEEFQRTTIVYGWGKRSKCVVKVSSIDMMGVHEVIAPKTLSRCILGYETAGIHHICNIKNREHTSVSKDFLTKI
jgi:hypothetical protein